MILLETQLASWLADFFWPFIRIGAVFAAAPVFSAKQVQARHRVILALLVTLVAAPVLPKMPMVEVMTPQWVLLIVQQLAIGLMMGFILQMVFGALVFGGQMMALKMGLGFATMVDPGSGMNAPVVAQIFLIMATLLFVVTNSHLILIQLVVESFHTLPVGAKFDSIHLWNLVSWASRMFAGGLLMSLPIVGTLLLVNLGMGIMARAAPQFNLFSIGFAITILLGIIIIWISMANIMTEFLDLLDEAFGLVAGTVGIEP
ncbi:MAG: flagellar biosynthetic protein FliR [Gammaproteobacteria bacterium SHHR-1]|uniref:flagellar biosynthetic protein FliR n=1 Tax=Magnetovirga frankeli TaxID=947516 RepID=UPI0012930FDE|nr:flagellar biosynthetic protein FliR [gamma proteobacterium SS-5]